MIALLLAIVCDLPHPTGYVLRPTRIVVHEDTHYADILNHAPNWPPYYPFSWNESRALIAHETTYAINAWHGGYYVGNDCFVRLAAPNLTVGQVEHYIPNAMWLYDSHDYRTYIVNHRNQTALDILDEWTCYANDACVSVERPIDGWVNSVERCITFSIYGTALAMAVKEQRPEYWEREKSFRLFVCWLLKRSEHVYLKGYQMPCYQFDRQEQHVERLRRAPEFEEMRIFIREELDGVWLEDK